MVSVQAARHIAPQGVAGTAAVRCRNAQSAVALVVEVVRGKSRVAIQRSTIDSAQAGHAYPVVAQTSACISRPPVPYATQATLTVAGRELRWRSRAVFISCNKPADPRCRLAVDAPRVVNDDLVGPAAFTCASDRKDLVWRVDLQEYSDGAWQSIGTSMIKRQSLFKGGRTYSEAAHQPCSNEVGPWPLRLRTSLRLQRYYNPTISKIGPEASITCPSATSTLTVQNLSSGGGRITSSPAGIDCGGGACSHPFPAGTQVTLTATPAQGFTFAGWDADCSGSAPTCTLTMDTDKTAIGKFRQTSGPPGG